MRDRERITVAPLPPAERPKGFNHGVTYSGERFPDFDAFADRAEAVCHQVCRGRWVMDFFHVHFKRAYDATLFALTL